MTNTRSIFLIAVIAAVATSACGWLRAPRPQLDSEKADAAATASFAPVSVRINAEDLGTTADLTSLRRMISNIMTARAANAVFREGSDQIENRVFIEVNAQMPIGQLADIV